jgi:DNA-binding CsgD family transcriptional regulator
MATVAVIDAELFGSTPARAAQTKPGVLLLDSSLRAIYTNSEALRILHYPHLLGDASAVEAFLARCVRPRLCTAEGQQAIHSNLTLFTFQSGRRIYACRAFELSGSNSELEFSTMLLIERDNSRSAVLSRICKQYNFTRRESVALGFLIEGLTSKEIAERMHISPNTVKVFLRLIMVKMGVNTRAAIVGKVASLAGEL